MQTAWILQSGDLKPHNRHGSIACLLRGNQEAARMSGHELSDPEISLLRERISLAAKHADLTHHEAEALDSAMVRLRRYGPTLFLSVGERQRLYNIFEKAGCFTRRRLP
jgi:hypothetical protein